MLRVPLELVPLIPRLDNLFWVTHQKGLVRHASVTPSAPVFVPWFPEPVCG